MLHKFFEEGHWFEPKKLGYGAGLPIAWQGWVLLAAYTGVIAGFCLLLTRGGVTGFVLGALGIVAATIALVLIARVRTRGGWKWRG
ncbi:MAG: hypothetical protein ACK4GD_07055 [Sphingomonadaceae bacterium]